MKVRILGCSGGIGGRHLHTSAMLVDDDILIDAGTGVGNLSVAELALIDHVFITHAHLDHIACLPFIVDTVGHLRDNPLTLYATQPTLDSLQTHIFNGTIWPDFSTIPDRSAPYLRFQAIELGQPVKLNGRTITALPATHSVPAVGYCLDSGVASMAFTGDTTSNDALWDVLNQIDNLRYLIIETAFPNHERALALIAKHLCPSLLKDELHKLKRRPDIYITHLKPSHVALTMREIDEGVAEFNPQMLQNDQVFDF